MYRPCVPVLFHLVKEESHLDTLFKLSRQCLILQDSVQSFKTVSNPSRQCPILQDSVQSFPPI
eukprot:scaffold21654_cov63-Cyclotella_meneghiniana.AAC.1